MSQINEVIEQYIAQRIQRALQRKDMMMDRMLSATGTPSQVSLPAENGETAPPVNIKVDPDLKYHLERGIANSWEKQGYISPEGILLMQLIRDMDRLLVLLSRLGGENERDKD